MVRLNGDVAEIFSDWLYKTMPDRALKILNKIKEAHGGKLNDSTFGRRMKGAGVLSKVIKDQMKMAKKKYFSDRELPAFNNELYMQFKNPQLTLF